VRIGIDAYPLTVRGGGIRRYTQQLLQGLSRIDDENEYVLYRDYRTPRDGDLGARFQWDLSHGPLQRWVEHLHLAGAAESIDLFHGTNYFAPHLDRYPTVLTVHDLSVHLFPERHPLKRRLRHKLLPGLCRRARKVIADSCNTRDDLVERYGIDSEKIDVIYLAAGDEFRPVRDADLRSRVRERHQLPARFVLFLGTLEPRKNLPSLIRAAARLKRRGSSHAFVIAGDGDPLFVRGLEALATAEGLVVGRDVVFTGFVEDEDLPALYSLCDLFVYPSIYEGFGLPPLEAMACGAPVVLPDNSSLSELYAGCSLLVNMSAADSLAGAIEQILGDPLGREFLIEEGQKRAQARTWDDVAKETLGVYRAADRMRNAAFSRRRRTRTSAVAGTPGQ